MLDLTWDERGVPTDDAIRRELRILYPGPHVRLWALALQARGSLHVNIDRAVLPEAGLRSGPKRR